MITKKMKVLDVVIKARCILGHRWEMTPEQIKKAEAFGVPMCPICGNAASVQRAVTK